MLGIVSAGSLGGGGEVTGQLHLFELPFAMESADVIHGLPPVDGAPTARAAARTWLASSAQPPPRTTCWVPAPGPAGFADGLDA